MTMREGKGNGCWRSLENEREISNVAKVFLNYYMGAIGTPNVAISSRYFYRKFSKVTRNKGEGKNSPNLDMTIISLD